MRKPYRTIEDVLRSSWAAAGQPMGRATTDRVLRSTKPEDSIYTDLRDGDDSLEQTEGEAAKKLPSFLALSRDVFQSFYSLMPRKDDNDLLSTAARKLNNSKIVNMVKGSRKGQETASARISRGDIPVVV